MTYRVGVSGAGRGLGPAAMFHLMPDCELAAVCDIDQSALERSRSQFPDAKLYTDYEAMLSDGLDIVMVGTPTPVHAEQTIAALNAGCHVLQELTLSDTLGGCRAILEAVNEHPKQKFMLAENCCYWAYILAWQGMWKQGLLGDFMYAEAHYVHNIRNLLRNADGTPTWRARRPPILYCTHSLGPLLKVTGERCTSVCCLHTGSKLEPELGSLDFMSAVFQTSSGGVINLLRAQAVAREPGFHYYSVYGTKGNVETSRPPVNPLRSSAYIEGIPYLDNSVDMPIGSDVSHKRLPPGAAAGGHGTMEYLMVNDFMESIRNDTPSPIDIHAALNMTLPGLFAYESAKQGGKPILIPELK